MATRLIPSYRQFHEKTGRGNAALLETLAEGLWDDAAGFEIDTFEVERAAATILSLVPREDEGWDQETQPYGEDAASALAYAYRARLNGDPREAAWAGRCAYESIDYFTREQLSARSADPGYEVLVQSHPLVQAELARQQRDLRDVARWEEAGRPSNTLAELRSRSEKKRETTIFFTGLRPSS